MKAFVYDIPVKVYFGSEQLGNLGPELKRFGSRVLLTYGGGSIKKSGLYQQVVSEINNAGLELYELAGIEPNPRIETVREGARICKENQIDVLLAVGGGSTIDATKFMAAGACTDSDPWDFLAKGTPVKKALPVVTVLTLSATGSEMDPYGVITNLTTNEKLGGGAPALVPKVSFLDPAVTYSVSKFQTACGSADILSHLMEEYFDMNQDLYMLDGVMEVLMKTVIRYAPIALEKPDDYEARANLMWASSWAINGFIVGSSKPEWSCHPMEHELSAFYDITHGLGLAILTPRWLRYCLDETTVSKYVQFGVNVFGIDKALPKMEIADKAIKELEHFLFDVMGLSRTLNEVNIDEQYFKTMANKACGGSVIKGFKTLAPEDVEKIYEMCR